MKWQAASHEKDSEMMASRLQDEENQKESAWDACDKRNNHIVNLAVGKKEILKENAMTKRRTRQLEEESAVVVKQHEDRTNEEVTKQKREARRIESKSNKQM